MRLLDKVKKYILIGILFLIQLSSCDKKLKSKTSEDSQKETDITPTKEPVDNNFHDFIEKFSQDSVFQLSRTKFPLKITWYDIENDKDSLIYKNISSFEKLDFRKTKSSGQFDRWEQKIFFVKKSNSAKIEIRGIDTGIMIDYLFEKVNEIWMFISIDDSST